MLILVRSFGRLLASDFPSENFTHKHATPLHNHDALIVFWDGKSKSTKSMINLAKEEGLKIEIIFYVNQS